MNRTSRDCVYILDEVRAILGDSLGWTLTSRDVDLPELQGEPEEIARDKCQLATEKVCVLL